MSEKFHFLKEIKKEDDAREEKKKLIDISTYAVQQLYRLNATLERIENLLAAFDKGGEMDVKLEKLNKLDFLYHIERRIEGIEKFLGSKKAESKVVSEAKSKDDVGTDK